MTTPARKTYEFRVYEQLGELYIKQERPKDAADTFNAFARKNPLHAQAPVMQARVIEIYEKSGFVNQAIEARKEYIARYGRTSEFRRVNPEGWEQGAAARQDAPGRARAPLPRDGAEDQVERRLAGGGALVPRVPGVVPERPGGGAEQLPARRAAVRGRSLRRGRGRVREGRPTAIRSTRRAPKPATARCSATRRC